MKYCVNCGGELNDNQKFCDKCGTKVTEIEENIDSFLEQQKYHTQNEYNKFASETTKTQFSMKWFKFLIYFGLFFGALVNFYYGIDLIIGNETVSLPSDAIQMINIVYALCLFLLAGYGIYVRFRLATFKKNAPMLLYVLCGSSVMFSAIYTVIVATLIEVSIFNIPNVRGNMIISIIMILLNIIYFEKRKKLFTK